MKIVFYCKIKQYLEEMAAIEERKPIKDRRIVPTMKDISVDAGLYYTTVNRIVNNKGKRFDYETMGKIAKALHERGFEVAVSDIIGMAIIDHEDKRDLKPPTLFKRVVNGDKAEQ